MRSVTSLPRGEIPLPASAARLRAGTVIETAGDAIRVATGDGVLRILALQPEGRRVMTAREFLAGRHVPAGPAAVVIAPARIAALRVLRAVGTDRADLPAALAQARPHLADERDRALLVELATGTLRWLGAIDYLIVQACEAAAYQLDTEVRDVLRLGIYQLLHLDRVPASAVVDDAVEMTRKAGKAARPVSSTPCSGRSAARGRCCRFLPGPLSVTAFR